MLKYLFKKRSRGSAVERRIHIAKADGSNPSDSTLKKQAPLLTYTFLCRGESLRIRGALLHPLEQERHDRLDQD